MADAENPAVIDGVETAEPHEERNWIEQLCGALFMVAMSSFLAFILFGVKLFQGTSKATHAHGYLGLGFLILLLLFTVTCVCVEAITSCIYGNIEGEQQEEGLPNVQP
jgi:uncharacterized membrane protein